MKLSGDSAPASYSDKPITYFSGIRRHFVDSLPPNPTGKLLDVGCARGDTAAYALETKRCGWCCGVEMCLEAASIAETKLSQVIVGNIETVELPFQNYFDVVLLSEVLEHLVDPWAALSKLHKTIKPGGVVIAGSPNVSHYSILLMMIKGEWAYENSGIMDGTHLRWFTPRSYRRMFEDCGFVVQSVAPAVPLRLKARLLNAMFFGKASHLFTKQIVLRSVKAV